MSEKLTRDYQAKCIQNIWKEWNRGVSKTMTVLATGLGKTFVAGQVAAMMPDNPIEIAHDVSRSLPSGQRMLWVCHREELAFQAQKALREATGRTVHLEMGDYRAAHRDASIVVAMVQSLVARRRHYKPDEFQYGVVDECFPAGTQVGGRAIESIREGDLIESFNHETLSIELRRVLRTSKRPAVGLLKVILSNGHSFTCTPEHPFFATTGVTDEREYVPASSLTYDHFVCRIESHEKNDSVRNTMHSVRKDGDDLTGYTLMGSGYEGKKGQGVLFAGMSNGEDSKDSSGIDGGSKSKVCKCQNEGKKPNALRTDSETSLRCNEGEMSTESRWERDRNDNSAENTTGGTCGSCSGCCSGICGENKIETTVPLSLQNRHLFAGQQALYRGGRWQSQSTDSTASGQEAGCVFHWERVDRVEILERSGQGEFGGVCPDGLVYNLEVEGNHNYFVNGYLVHNCHHATAKTYRAVIDYFSGIRRWLGLTATPKRADGVALGKVFESVAYHMEVNTAVDLGWLVPPRQRISSCRDIDLRNVDTVAGDFHKAQLKEQLMKQQVVDQIARKTIAVADGRQTIVFCQTVDQAHALSRVFTLLGENSVSICGKTLPGIRKNRVEKFRSGAARFLCQVNICTEGFDVPECEVISMARPTKSQPVFAQAVGRGLRPLKPPQGTTATERRREIAVSTKPHATVLDFYGNTGRHKLCNTGDLLGGEYDDEVRALAVRKAQEIDQDFDMIALLESCKEEIAKLPKAARAGTADETETDKLYRLFAQALFRYEPHPCDALGIDPKVPEAAIEKDDAYGGSLSRATRCLENHRLTATEIGKMSNRQIVYCARVLEDRESRGLATYPQIRLLYKHGYPPNMTRAEASGKIARVKANKGRRPADDGPNLVLAKLVDRLTVGKR